MSTPADGRSTIALSSPESANKRGCFLSRLFLGPVSKPKKKKAGVRTTKAQQEKTPGKEGAERAPEETNSAPEQIDADGIRTLLGKTADVSKAGFSSGLAFVVLGLQLHQ